MSQLNKKKATGEQHNRVGAVGSLAGMKGTVLTMALAEVCGSWLGLTSLGMRFYAIPAQAIGQEQKRVVTLSEVAKIVRSLIVIESVYFAKQAYQDVRSSRI
jgi:hypothetical protein